MRMPHGGNSPGLVHDFHDHAAMDISVSVGVRWEHELAELDARLTGRFFRHRVAIVSKTEGAPYSTRVGEIAPGTQVTASIRLVKRLGEGGMGSVWLAHHEGLRTDVVVKFLLARLTDDATSRARFSRE